MHVCTYMYIYIHYTYMYVYMYTYMQQFMHTLIYTHIYTHTHIYIYPPKKYIHKICKHLIIRENFSTSGAITNQKEYLAR